MFSSKAITSQTCSHYATPLSWPTETAFVVTADHQDGVLEVCTLVHVYRGKGLRAMACNMFVLLNSKAVPRLVTPVNAAISLYSSNSRLGDDFFLLLFVVFY